MTDLTVQDVSTLLPILQLVNPNQIQRYSISAGQVKPFITSGGADVLLPRPDAIREVLIQAMGK